MQDIFCGTAICLLVLPPMKGIILAGGSGTRLYPLTLAASKQILPVYDKPMIYYPLSALMLAGIKEVLVISTPHDLPHFKKLLGDGDQWGMRFEYKEQPHPGGLAQAYLIGEDFLKGSPSCLVLGDNIFYGHKFSESVQKGVAIKNGAMIFGYYVTDPERYGVVEFDQSGKVVSLVEKPKSPNSNYAIPGIYFYDGTATQKAKKLKPSPRGELEITDLNKMYLEEGSLRVELLGRGMAWLDTGTHDSLLEASHFISVIEKRQGLKVGCPEEIAFRNKFITKDQLLMLAEKLSNSGYGKYLIKVAQE